MGMPGFDRILTRARAGRADRLAKPVNKITDNKVAVPAFAFA